MQTELNILFWPLAIFFSAKSVPKIGKTPKFLSNRHAKVSTLNSFSAGPLSKISQRFVREFFSTLNSHNAAGEREGGSAPLHPPAAVAAHSAERVKVYNSFVF